MRGQSYDNAANMSGIYTGLQARIKAMNPLAYYVPCAGHSLNLVGTSAASSCLGSVSYSRFLQALYNFFSASTYRWDHLKAALPAEGIVVKSLSETRWSARADAVKAVFLHYLEIKSALENICSDSRQTVATKLEGEGLIRQMEAFETALLTVIWYKILTRFNATSLSLQKVETDLLSVVKLYESLISFVSEMRQGQFDEIEDQARAFAEPVYTETTKRTKKRKHFFDESVGNETQLDPREKFKVDNFYTILDCLRNELEHRVNAYSEIKKLFSFFTEYDSMKYDDLKAQLELVVSTYYSDLEASVLEEFLQFKDILSSESDRSVTNISTLLRSKDGILTTAFPNISILVRIFLTILITNREGERSFSTLSRVKNT
ncbi:Zinc finger MYM-type protein 1-like 5 [Homarus americanus]|uniref:Zinc finger MYM-type protein 1-like 5 n=1 Tax=Homarus americanus TaxID=6706 RepID=A0A8J5JGT2_HOMAM|nr:Zinc finger MYM-type protein 1-like 5 [Homarus americanus]